MQADAGQGISGSSPPVRGAQNELCQPPAPSGLIPARAGSTAWLPTQTVSTWAHPRPCGEHLAGRLVLNSALGSSPPVRGALTDIANCAADLGLIPARAGSTPPSTKYPNAHGAHPRPCGEH